MVRILYFKDQCLNRPINMRIFFSYISRFFLNYCISPDIHIILFFKNNSILHKKEVGFLNELLRLNY